MFKAILLCILAALCLAGCSTFKGGMPNLPFDVERDLGVAKENLKTAASVETYYSSPSADARNKFVTSRLVIINIEYLQYIKSLAAEESQMHSATDILVLTLDIASTAFSPATTKTVLSAISSSLSGARLSIDKNAYYDKTVSALISSMNAERKEVLKRILRGTAMDLNGYPFEVALNDINEYYLAGTVQGALSSIQRDAGAKEVTANIEINKFLSSRDTKFIDITTQTKVDKLLDDVEKLNDDALFGLVKAPPITDELVDKIVIARDPKNLRGSDRKAAISILKLRIVMSKRDGDSLRAWEAAIKSVTK